MSKKAVVLLSMGMLAMVAGADTVNFTAGEGYTTPGALTDYAGWNGNSEFTVNTNGTGTVGWGGSTSGKQINYETGVAATALTIETSIQFRMTEAGTYSSGSRGVAGVALGPNTTDSTQQFDDVRAYVNRTSATSFQLVLQNSTLGSYTPRLLGNGFQQSAVGLDGTVGDDSDLLEIKLVLHRGATEADWTADAILKNVTTGATVYQTLNYGLESPASYFEGTLYGGVLSSSTDALTGLVDRQIESFTVIPEPATPGLMGLASVGTDMRFTTTLNRSAVDAPGYALDVQHDLSTPETVVMISPEGWSTEWSIKEFALVDGGTRFSFDLQQDPPDIYPIATGPLFNEFHLVNVVLRDGGGTAWPGLAVLSFYSFAERVYVKVRFVTHSGGYVIHADDGLASDNFVYESHSNFVGFAGSSSISAVEFQLQCSQDFQALEAPVGDAVILPSAHMGFASTTPGETGLFSTGLANTNVLTLAYAVNQTWNPDENHEFGFMVAPGDDDREVAALLAQHEHLAALALDASGRTVAFSPMRGLWEFSSPYYAGQDKGIIKSTDITLGNSAAEAVEVVVDHRNAWGGYSASFTRDEAGAPLPMLPQHYINYPENAAEGESGGGRMYNRFIVPANESLAYTFQTFYRGGATNSAGFHYDWIQRDTLGHKPNLQPISHYTINRQETLTLRHDPISATDWRKHPDNLRDEFDVANSASAAKTEFFQVQLVSGETLELVSTKVEISQAGPFFVEETYTVESVPPGIAGTLRFWSAAWMDEAYGTVPFGEGNSRWGAEANLVSTQTLTVDTGAAIPISMLSMHRSPPGYFQAFGYSSLNSGTQTINIVPEVHQSGEVLPQPFYAGFYKGMNLINRKSALTGALFSIPYSDVTGNPTLAVWDWDVEFNGTPAAPALRLDAVPPAATDWYRNWYVGPETIPSTIAAGSRIAFKVMGSTGGDSSSTASYGETHFNTWKNIRVTAVVGTVLSDFPPKVRADANGRAEFSVSGGTEWIPVTVVGINPDITQLTVESGIDAANLQALAAPVAGEPWYQVKTDEATGLTSVSVPVHSSDATLPRSRYVRVVSGSGSEDADNDGINNATEGSGDVDQDGFANYIDPDADGNGVGDALEGQADTDGDGLADYLDADNDGDAANDQSEELAGGFINDGYYSHGFDLAGALGGWESDILHQGRPTVSNGFYSAAITGNDSKLTLSGLNLSGNPVQTVLMRMRLSQGGGSFVLFWANEDGGFAALRSTSVAIRSGGGFNTYIFDLSAHAEWLGKTITALRIDPVGPTGIGGTVEIDWIFLSNGDFDGDLVSDASEIAAGTDFSNPQGPQQWSITDGQSLPGSVEVRSLFLARSGLFYRVLKKTDLLEDVAWEELFPLGPYGGDTQVDVLLEETIESQSFYRIDPF